MMKIVKRVKRGYKKDLVALDTRLDMLRQRHVEVREFIRELSDAPGGEVYDEAISELVELERVGKHLRRVRANLNYILTVRTSKATLPPRLGEQILLLILNKDERINIPGDLEEEFAEIVTKHGARFAKVWYYKQVAASAWPMIRKGVRWELLASLGEWIRQII